MFGESGLDEAEKIIKKMDKIDTMFIPKGYPPPPDVDANDRDQLYLGVPQISK